MQSRRRLLIPQRTVMVLRLEQPQCGTC
uniref:Uncharacterized protein n=1 Tax=Arundo donax TaxID=35708 RepID=A0A0A9GJT2_ARUDO